MHMLAIINDHKSFKLFIYLSLHVFTSGCHCSTVLSLATHTFCGQLCLSCCSCLQVLLGYRLKWPRRTVRALLSFALVYYIATRLLQTVMVLYMVIGWASYPAVHATAAFIVVAILFGAFSVIQGYTLVIYRAIGRKLSRDEKGNGCSANEAVAEEA